tara:strand:+ start:1264 stop:1602 length:339 start_codon:yes stop_codon:yes gene_type:complete
MTKFTKENLIKNSEYVMYVTPENPRGRIVARFKRSKGAMGTFMTHLRRYWSPEDYFSLLDDGYAPLEIVEMTGYISPHIKKWLKKGGYPLTKEGEKQWLSDQVKNWETKRVS